MRTNLHFAYLKTNFSPLRDRSGRGCQRACFQSGRVLALATRSPPATKLEAAAVRGVKDKCSPVLLDRPVRDRISSRPRDTFVIGFDARRLSTSSSRSPCLRISCLRFTYLRTSCLRSSCLRSPCLHSSCLHSSCLRSSCLRSSRSDNAGCVHSLTVCMLLVLPSKTAIMQFFRGSRFSPK